MAQIGNRLLRTAACLLVSGISVGCLGASTADECLTLSEIEAMDNGFWASYPSAEEFSRYAAPDMKIATNIADVAEINSSWRTGPERAEQLALFLGKYPEYFSSLKFAHQPTYLYFMGGVHRADSVKSSDEYPIGQCVSMFHFESNDKRCMSGQRVRALRLSFIKDSGKIELQTVQIAMEGC